MHSAIWFIWFRGVEKNAYSLEAINPTNPLVDLPITQPSVIGAVGPFRTQSYKPAEHCQEITQACLAGLSRNTKARKVAFDLWKCLNVNISTRWNPNPYPYFQSHCHCSMCGWGAGGLCLWCESIISPVQSVSLHVITNSSANIVFRSSNMPWDYIMWKLVFWILCGLFPLIINRKVTLVTLGPYCS